MPSADFCAAVRSPYSDLSLVAETQRRSPEVRSTAFTARPPNLPPRSLMTMDFAIISSLVRPGRPRYSVFVHRAAALLHASLRPHLTMAPLRFANPSPPSGWIEDSHLQAVDHARHTKQRLRYQPFFTALAVKPSCHGSAFSRVGASGNPGAVHTVACGQLDLDFIALGIDRVVAGLDLPWSFRPKCSAAIPSPIDPTRWPSGVNLQPGYSRSSSATAR